MPWNEAALRLWVRVGGFYLLPALAILVILARHAASRAARGSPRLQRALLAMLVGLAALGPLVWTNFFNWHYGGYLNTHEFFHYYLGSKYAPEIGYFDLYNAALIADADTGLRYRPPDGGLRDLRTYRPTGVEAVLAQADRHRSLFSEERWREWVKDVSFFKSRMGPGWIEVLRDHGYNATPVQALLVGRLLTNRVSTDSPAGMTALALLDVVLLAAAIAAVAWAFGLWPALLMVVFLASSYMLAHVHLKGALLRTDFVVALVLATCLLKKGRAPFLAGALVGYATLSRLFPAVFLFGPAVQLAFELSRPAKELGKKRALLLAGASIAAAALLLPLGWSLLGEELRRTLEARLLPAPALLALALLPAALFLAAGALAVHVTLERRIAPARPLLLAGFAATVAVLLAVSLVPEGGTRRWAEFAEKIALHRANYNHWNVGFTSVAIARFDPPGSPNRTQEARAWPGRVHYRQEDVERREPLLRLVQLAALALSVPAVRTLPAAAALAFGFVPGFFLVAPTYYYYVVLLLPFLFFATFFDALEGTLGLAYLFLAGLLGFSFYFRWDQYFPTTYWNSVLMLGLALGMLATAWRQRHPPAAAPRPPRRGKERRSIAPGRVRLL